ncbi:MAG: hypothetical protein KGH94_05245 [Candidatus Micrarchaeota archaeon]|nr:hypothetical protein [Candidatus Micrarchaeota archaeon]
MPEARGAIRKIASERIEILYNTAVKVYSSDQGLAGEYIRLLLEIGRHYKVKIPKEMAARICKKCQLPLVEGGNLEIRVLAKQRRRIYRCKSCGSVNSLAFRKGSV